MATGHRWTKADDAELIRLHGQGLPLVQIAKLMGVSVGSIHSHAKAQKPPLSWDTSQVQAANIARHDRARERRLDNIERLQAFHDRLMTQAEQTTWAHVARGPMGTEEVRQLDFIPAADARDVSQAAKNNLQTMAQLEAVDADAGLARAKSLVSDLAAELGVLPMEPDQ